MVADLAQHNCIVLRQLTGDYAICRSTRTAMTMGLSNDSKVALSLALGHGLILRSRWDVQQYLEEGRLSGLLLDHQAPRADIYAVYQHRRHILQRISMFSSCLAQQLAKRLPSTVLP